MGVHTKAVAASATIETIAYRLADQLIRTSVTTGKSVETIARTVNMTDIRFITHRPVKDADLPVIRTKAIRIANAQLSA